MWKFKLRFLVFFCLLPIAHYGQYISLHEEPFDKHYSPTGRPRMVAEWEPAIGALITWPPALPHKLIIELAKDTKLYTVVENRDSQREAIEWFMKWGILPDRVKFITAPMDEDAWWTRDWGPHGIFTPAGELKLGDARFVYSTPFSGLSCNDTLGFIYKDDQGRILKTNIDDLINEYISQSTPFDILKLPFVFTGGNVFTDGQRTGFASCIIANENRYSDVSDEKFFTDVRQLTGLEHFNIISNFEEAGIQHIDCLMKLLDEERIMVMRTPTDHPAYEQYEGIVENELRFLKNAYGRPYEILRLDTDRYLKDKLAAYSNSLILNKVIYVPLYGIPQDSIAMQQWKDAMPGYTVKGFEYFTKNEPFVDPNARTHYPTFGWQSGDALHCRVRAIWDPEMIYLSADRLPKEISLASNITINLIAKDYSGKGFPTTPVVSWRMKGEKQWKMASLSKTPIDDLYTVDIDGLHSEGIMEYYFTAVSLSGKTFQLPMVAQNGPFTTKVVVKSR